MLITERLLGVTLTGGLEESITHRLQETHQDFNLTLKPRADI